MSSFLEGRKHSSARLAARGQATSHYNGVEFLGYSAVDLHCADAWGDVPHVAEGDAGEVAAPADGHRDTAQRSADQVAQRLAQIEALVRVLPNAIQRMGMVGLTDGFLKSHLQYHSMHYSHTQCMHRSARIPN